MVGLVATLDADKITVPVWFWLGIGAATLAALSVLGGAALAVILRNVSREITELLELEPLALARPARTRRPVVRV
jgi:hypothetical protein